MLSNVLLFFVQLFILMPFQAEIGERLVKAGAPVELLQQVRTCVAVATPAVVQRTSGDPLWAAKATLRIWVLQTPPAQLVGEAAPACVPAIEAGRAYLRGGSS